jgi:hypothetical protein
MSIKSDMQCDTFCRSQSFEKFSLTTSCHLFWSSRVNAIERQKINVAFTTIARDWRKKEQRVKLIEVEQIFVSLKFDQKI